MKFGTFFVIDDSVWRVFSGVDSANGLNCGKISS